MPRVLPECLAGSFFSWRFGGAIGLRSFLQTGLGPLMAAFWALLEEDERHALRRVNLERQDKPLAFGANDGHPAHGRSGR